MPAVGVHIEVEDDDSACRQHRSSRLRPSQDMELFQNASLFVSDDGLNWHKHSHITNNDDDDPGLGFAPDGRMLVVSRNGGAYKHAIANVSNLPYTAWRTLQVYKTIHQPTVIHHKSHWIIGCRSVDDKTFEPNRFDPYNSLQVRNDTWLWFLNDGTIELTEATTLPSWGDCGQLGFPPTLEGYLLVAYYSCSQMIDRNRPVGGDRHHGKYTTRRFT